MRKTACRHAEFAQSQRQSKTMRTAPERREIWNLRSWSPFRGLEGTSKKYLKKYMDVERRRGAETTCVREGPSPLRASLNRGKRRCGRGLNCGRGGRKFAKRRKRCARWCRLLRVRGGRRWT